VEKNKPKQELQDEMEEPEMEVGLLSLGLTNGKVIILYDEPILEKIRKELNTLEYRALVDSIEYALGRFYLALHGGAQ
jgi:hypothetical protein